MRIADQLFKKLFITWAALCILAVPFMSLDAGITEDEYQHNEHGKRLLAWYQGKDDRAVSPPFDENGVWKVTENESAINIYGGLFDLLDSFLYQTLFHKFIGEYEFRHVLSALFGAALLIFTGLIGQRLSKSWAIGLVTLIIATLTPRIIGNSLSNCKDIPLATFFAFSIFHMVAFISELPAIKIKRLVWLALSFMLALAVRSGAIILIFYLGLFTGILVAWLLYKKEIDLKCTLQIAASVTGVSIVGYLACSLCWPWAMQNPVANPLRSLSVFKSFTAFNSYALFEGKWLDNNSIPWYFVPEWLYITLPVIVISGIVLYLIFLPGILHGTVKERVMHSLLIFSVLFPLLSIIINKSNIYDGARHILFIIPSVVVIAAAGWCALLKVIEDKYLKITTGLAFLILLLEPALFIIKNNPVQAMYFSPLMGGPKGAWMKYEMDYWGYSIKPAIDWIEENDTLYKSGSKARVRLWYGEQLKLKYYLDKSQKLQYTQAMENSADWEYFIQMPAEAKYRKDILYHWPPKGTVHEITTGGAPLCAIIRNPLAPVVVPRTERINYTPSANFEPSMKYIQTGDKFHKAGDHNKSIIEFKKALLIDSLNIFAYNNLAACYNELDMFDDAISFAQKGLGIAPDFQLLQNNLAEANGKKNSIAYSETYFFNNSYYYYMQGDFHRSIEAANKALQYNPENAAAWNNICSAYNELHEFEKALKACNEAVRLDPTNERMRNNRQETLNAINRVKSGK